MTGKKRLIEGHVLQGHEIIVALKVQYSVDQQKRVTVRQMTEHLMDIHRVQGCLPYVEEGSDAGNTRLDAV
jgi:hypothetical protein